MNERITSETELSGVAQRMLEVYAQQRVFIFEGDLGAGKTTFIKAICHQLGVEEVMSSPTFGIVNEYLGTRGESIYHIDCYRMEREEEAYDIGLHESLTSGAYCFVEWPTVVENLLPQSYVRVSIQVRETHRTFNFILE